MLVVFDLDFTLWDCGGVWCDHTNPPYTKRNNGVFDAYGRAISLYPGVMELLDYLKHKKITMALASRTSEQSWAKNLMRLLNIEHYFDYQEIYPSSKTVHFNKLQRDTNIEFSNMYFFDDEHRNITEVSNLGVNCLYVSSGINYEEALNFIQNT